MTDAAVLLARLREEARAGMDAAAGGAAVCVFTREGRPVPGIKYHEGRWAALTEVARRCRRTGEDPEPVSVEVRADWTEQLERLPAPGRRPGLDRLPRGRDRRPRRPRARHRRTGVAQGPSGAARPARGRPRRGGPEPWNIPPGVFCYRLHTTRPKGNPTWLPWS